MNEYELMRNKRREIEGKPPVERYDPALPRSTMNDIQAAEAMRAAASAQRMREWTPGSVFK